MIYSNFNNGKSIYLYICSFIVLDKMSEDTACFTRVTLIYQTYNFMVYL